MFRPFSSILLTPDETGGNGGGDATPEPTPSGQGTAAQPEGNQPKEQPNGRVVSEDEYARLQRAAERASGADKFWSKLQERGIKDEGSLMQSLEQAQKVQSLEQNPQTRGILEALTREPEQDDSQSDDRPLTAKDAQQLLSQTLMKYDQEKEQKQYQKQIQQARQTEAALLNDAIRDERVGSIFGEHSFDDALDGKAGRPAQALAVLLDHVAYSNAPRSGNAVLPITDKAEIQKQLDAVLEIVGELKGIDLDGKQEDEGQREPEGKRGAVVTDDGESQRKPWDHKAAASRFSQIYDRELQRAGG